MQQHSEATSQYWCDHHKRVFVSPARGRRFSNKEAELISQCAIDFVEQKRFILDEMSKNKSNKM